MALEQTFSTEDILKTKEFSDFYKAAIAFCDFIENYSTELNYDFLRIAMQNILNLYDSGLKLQWVDLQSNIEYDEKLDKTKFDNILFFIASRLGVLRYYWHVFDPTNDKDTMPVCGDLLDDLGDIYKDIKYSVLIFNLGKEDCKENALWQFKSDFDGHWGNHCIHALSAMHFYLQNK